MTIKELNNKIMEVTKGRHTLQTAIKRISYQYTAEYNDYINQYCKTKDEKEKEYWKNKIKETKEIACKVEEIATEIY